MSMPERKWLRHQIPEWVDQNSNWFLTLCCKHRGCSVLTNNTCHAAVIEALMVYQSQSRLCLKQEVTMPDHIHIIGRFDHRRGLASTVESLKRFLARKHGIVWQDGFFDHRIRSDKLLRETSDYVRMNPVRAGLIKSAEEWPYRWPR